MSTKIYDAWRLPAGVTPFTDMTLLPRLRKATIDANIAEAITQMEHGVAPWADPYALALHTRRKWLASAQFGGPNSVFYDTNNASLGFLLHGGAWYAKGFNLIPQHREVILSQAWDDFHYQNQADRPDDISDDEWEHRRHTWDNDLTINGSLSHWLCHQVCEPFALPIQPLIDHAKEILS